MKWNPKETPDSNVIEPQMANLRVDGQEEVGGTDKDPRPLRVTAHFTVIETESGAFEGFRVDRAFWLGTKEDPQCQDPATRKSRDWTAYKSFLKAAMVTPTGNTEEEAELVRTAELTGMIGIRAGKDKAGNPKDYNTVRYFYRLGTKSLGLLAPRTNSNNGNARSAAETATVKQTYADE